MANRTVKDAKSIKGTNPQYLIEKIIRSRIYDSKYWKEECFALTAELLVDKAMELKFIGGVFGGNIKPTPFLCLILKMLQIQPEKEIIVEFIRNEEFKYVRALGAYYMRLTGTSLDCYNYLEPLLNDFRKLRRQNREGAFDLTHVDEFVDDLLREERALDVILPRIQKRSILEETNVLMPRTSVLDDDDDDDDDEMDLAESKDDDKRKEAKSSGKSSRHLYKDDGKKRRGHSSDSDSSDRRRKGERDKERDRRDDRSHRKDKRREAESSHDRDRTDRRDKDRDRDRNERSRFRGEREKDRGDRDYGRNRESEKDRHHHRDTRDRDSDRHRSSRRYD